MVIVCIGTPTITGDAVAPIAGDMLINAGINAYVYGTTSRPITGVNIGSYMNLIRIMHSGERVIAIDSALGVKEDVGVVKVVKGGVKPGGAFGKKHGKVGEYGILAQVGKYDDMPMQELMNTPYALVHSLAKKCTTLAVGITSKFQQIK